MISHQNRGLVLQRQQCLARHYIAVGALAGCVETCSSGGNGGCSGNRASTHCNIRIWATVKPCKSGANPPEGRAVMLEILPGGGVLRQQCLKMNSSTCKASDGLIMRNRMRPGKRAMALGHNRCKALDRPKAFYKVSKTGPLDPTV